MLSREILLNALQGGLQPLPYVQAMWQGGAVAFQRIDQWSDIDLMLLADDERVPDTAAVVEQILASLSPITLRYELPQPSWHGHWQAFYQLEDAGPFLMIDLVILKVSSKNWFLEREIHGEVLIHFDKQGVVKSPPFSIEAHLKQIEGRLETLNVTFGLFQSLTEKELNRGNGIEAFSYYQSFTLRPLVEVLRIRYDPARYNFHTRYLYYILPPKVIQRLEPFFFVSDLEQLRGKFVQAQAFFREALNEIDLDVVRQQLEAGVQ